MSYGNRVTYIQRQQRGKHTPQRQATLDKRAAKLAAQQRAAALEV